MSAYLQSPLIEVVGMGAIALFAVTGVLAARRELDLFSLLVIGVVTAVGGGTLRDLLLGVPVFWIHRFDYVWTAAGASLLSFVALTRHRVVTAVFLYLDALGVALFSVMAMVKSVALGFSGEVAVLMGIVTGIGGGVIRDLLTQQPTLFLQRDLYATPMLIGGLLFVLLEPVLSRDTAAVLAMGTIFTIRAAAIHWHLRYPDLLTFRHTPRD